MWGGTGVYTPVDFCRQELNCTIVEINPRYCMMHVDMTYAYGLEISAIFA